MKKVILAMFIIAIGFTSCKKDSNDSKEQTVSLSSLPASITQYVDSNYPDASLYEAAMVKHATAKYIVTLNTDEELAFTENGSYLGDGEKYHNQGHKDKHHSHQGHHGGHHGNTTNHGIPIDSLSSSIIGYVTTNYPAFTVKHAEADSTCQYGMITEVVIFQQGVAPIKLYFDPSGSYLMSSSRLMYTNLPVVVKNTITASYATYSPKIKALKLDLANNTVAYYVYLFNGQTHKRITIADTGVVICEQ
ncbi:MAG: PepSY-like domain-containing protein [Bacteroidetes bacterium]|nr:PepSY-like domain-containing protein [Bacteroidota bacterium]